MAVYTVIRSARRTTAVQVKADGSVIVRAPLRAEDAQIEAFMRQQEPWIERARQRLAEQQAARLAVAPFTKAEIEAMCRDAKAIVPARASAWAQRMGVSFGRVTIRCQRSKWGSCNAKGDLSINCLLMRAPEEVLDYILVHELCHRKQMNHSAAFWAEVAKVLPDYRQRERWLKEHGRELIDRIR